MPLTGDVHIDDWLIDYLDGAVDELHMKKLERHVKSCADCRVKVASYERARAAYGALDEEPSTSITDLILSESRKPVPTGRSKLSWLIAAAAVVLLAFAILGPKEVSSPEIDCAELRRDGERLAGEGSYEEAIQRFAEAIRCDPTSPGVASDYHQQGTLFAELGQGEAALERLQHVLDAFPNYEDRPDVLLKIGDVQEARGDAAKAYAAYTQYIEEFPDRQLDAQERINEIILTDEAVQQLRSLGYIR